MTETVLQIDALECHPAANEFPMLDERRLKELAADIGKNGLLEPIELFGGQLLDGRNRLKACSVAGVEPRFVTVECNNPWWYVWSKNGQRRDLADLTRSTSFLGCKAGADAFEQARAEAEAKRREGIAEQSKKTIASQPRDEHGRLTRDDHNTDGHHGESEPDQTETPQAATAKQPEPTEKPAAEPRKRKRENTAAHALAQQAGVGRGIMEKAISIANHDKRHGTQYVEQIKQGAIKPTKALTEVRKANLAEKTKAQIDQGTEQATIKQQDAAAFLAGLDDASVDLLLTDPPYSTDVEDIGVFIDSWLPSALAKIKPTGRAYICIGAYPNELHAYLSALSNQTRMTLANVLVWTYRNTLGPAPKMDYKLNWQAILYLRGAEASDLDCPVMKEQFSVLDINAPDGRQGDRYHAWQKPMEIGERFVRHSTAPGALVVDPFACTGTFLLAAAKLGRKAIGCDLSSASISIATARGCTLVEQEVRHAA